MQLKKINTIIEQLTSHDFYWRTTKKAVGRTNTKSIDKGSDRCPTVAAKTCL